MKISKGLVAANLLVVGIALASILNMLVIQPVYPANNIITDERTPLFRWSGWKGSYELLIDDDQDFSSPFSFKVSGNSYAMANELEFGTYWWKVRSSDAESAPMKLTIVSSVALSRLESNTIQNSGNAMLLVHRSGLTGAVTLAVNQTLELEDRENVKAEQK